MAMRGVFIFKNIQVPNLIRKEPPDVVKKEEDRIRLLELFNGNWKDNKFRDIINPEARYSLEQQRYFETLPKNRNNLIREMVKEEENTQTDRTGS